MKEIHISNRLRHASAWGLCTSASSLTFGAEIALAKYSPAAAILIGSYAVPFALATTGLAVIEYKEMFDTSSHNSNPEQ